MYIPNVYREDDLDRLLAFMQANTMVTFVSILEGAPFASHIPVVVRSGRDSGDRPHSAEQSPLSLSLMGHFARANPHWRAFAAATPEPDPDSQESAALPESLVIFSGPHAYISPALYANRESVPTWNFMAVHAYGRPRIFTADTEYDRVFQSLEELIAATDEGYLDQWRALSARYRDGMMQGIVVFEMAVTRLEGKYKLSQNRPETDQETVAQALLGYEDTAARQIGQAMRANLGLTAE